MGGDKKEGTTVVNESTKVEPTAEETAFNKLRLEQQQAIQPQAIDMQKNAYNLGNLLLQGLGLPGYLSGLPEGVPNQQIPLSAGQMGEDYTQDLVKQSLRDIFPQFQAMGLPIESGVAQSIAGRTAGDIRRGVAEGNVNRELGVREANLNASMTTQYQNMNNLLNLLNLAVGGQAQIQSPVIATGNALGQSLAGLRSTSGTETETKYRPSGLGNLIGGVAGGVGGSFIGQPLAGAGIGSAVGGLF